MINKQASNIHTISKVIFGILLATYSIWLYETIDYARKYNLSPESELLPHIPLIPSLIIFLFAILWIQKIPKLIGALLIILGITSGVLLFRYPVFDDFVTTSDYMCNLILCLPTYILMIIMGLFYLIMGFSDDRKQRIVDVNQPV